MDENLLLSIGKMVGKHLFRKTGLSKYTDELMDMAEDLSGGDVRRHEMKDSEPKKTAPVKPAGKPVTQVRFAKTEDKTYYVRVYSVGESKVKAMAILRDYTQLSIAETKELIEKAPCVIYETNKPMEARKMVQELQEAGVEVEDDITGAICKQNSADSGVTAPFEFYIENVVQTAGERYAAKGCVVNGRISVGEDVVLPVIRDEAITTSIFSISKGGSMVQAANAGEHVLLELADAEYYQIGIHGIIRRDI